MPPVFLVQIEDPSYWILKPGEAWHGFNDEDVANDYYLLDPTKVTILTPGVNSPGLINTDEVELKDDGIPAKIVAQFLESRKINIAKGGDYIILVLFSVGNSKGKWGTLLEALLGFKDFYDNGANISEAIPNLAESNPSRYGVSESNLPSDTELTTTLQAMLDSADVESPAWAYKTLKELCEIMHKVIKGLALPTGHIKACNSIGEQALSPGAAYQTLIKQDGTIKTPIRDMLGQTSAVMVAPYPPGIPILMPGEKVEQVHIDYMKALEVYRRIFPEFGGVPHGLEDNGGFVMRKVIESGEVPQEAKISKRSIPNLQASFRRHGDR